MLRPIGWWIESLADEERPAPQELVGQQPEGLAHYVEAHGILFPEAFIDHALAGHAPRKPDSEEEYEFAEWIRWSQDRRVPAMKVSRHRALAGAQTSEALEERRLSEALEREYGLSTEKCCKQCDRRAYGQAGLCGALVG